MPQVPYNPVPQVGAELNPTPRLSLDTPAAAFGGTVARAKAQFGSELEQAGDTLFKRAMAMQELANHSEAQLADANFMEEVGKLDSQFRTLQGKDAVAAYPKYITGLKELRAKSREGLSNEASQRMFDTSSLNTVGNAIRYGGLHAATENKNFAIGAAAARVQSARNAALQNPLDEKGFQANLDQTVSNTEALWRLKGADEDTIKNAKDIAVSDLWYYRIAGLSRTDPFSANKMLEKATKDGKLVGEDIAKVTSIVQDKMRTVGARNIASDQTNGKDISWGQKIVPIGNAKQAISSIESGSPSGDYSLQGPEVFKKDGTSRGRALGRYQVMPENLPSWLKEAGLPSMTPQEFLSNPKAQDQVFETVFGRYMKETGNFNDAASKWFSGRTLKEASAAGANDRYTRVEDYVSKANATLGRTLPLADRVAAGRATAEGMSSDPLFADATEQRIISDHNYRLAVERNDTYINRQTINNALLGGDSGDKPKTIEELTADPETAAAWQKLDSTSKRSVMDQLAKNARGDKVTWDPAGNRLRTFQGLIGLAESDPASFLDVDVVGQDLPDTAKKQLIQLQQTKKNNAEGDPRITRAMGIMRPVLEGAGITHKDNPSAYNQFYGAMSLAIQQFQEDEKRPPKANDIQELGTRLLQQQKGTGWFSDYRLFEVPIPTKNREQIEADAKTKGFTLTDEEIQNIYVGQLYQSLYGKSKATP